MGEDLNLEDLARRSTLSIRTLRYYMQEGLIPGPDTAGKYASYSQRHLDHLSMIQRLKGLHLPLKEIRHLISNMTGEDMKRILKYQDTLYYQRGQREKEEIKKESPKSTSELSSALEYIQHLEQRQSRVRSIAESPPAYPRAKNKRNQRSEAKMFKNMGELIQQTENWSKIKLGEGVELNVREEVSKTHQREIEVLLKTARQLFGINKQEDLENG